MTKREIKTIIRHHSNGVSKDVCQTAIIQLCCPSIKREEINILVNALSYFDSETFMFNLPVGDYTAEINKIKKQG